MNYLLYGIDKSLINKEIDNIINKNNILKESISEYILPDNSVEDIIEDITTIGMFSNKKAIIVNNFNLLLSMDTSFLENYLDNYNKDIYLIFVSNEEKIDSRKKLVKLINKNGKVLEFNKKDIGNINKYFKDYIKDNNYDMKDIDINYLINRLSNNIDLIKNELDKLMLYKIDDKIINREDIDNLIEPSIEEEIYNLTDAVIKKDIKRSIDLYHYFLDNNYDSIAMIPMIGNQFRFLYQVKKLSSMGKSNDVISKELGVHPYRVKLAIETNYNYTEDDYLKYLYKLATMDERIKMGELNKDLALELFLLDKDI